QYNPDEEIRTIQRKLHLRNVEENVSREQSRRTVFQRFPLLAPAAGLAAVLALSLLPLITRTTTDRGKEDVRLKGLTPQLQVFLKQNPEPLKLKSGDTVREGDVLQLRFLRRPRQPYAALSRDHPDGRSVEERRPDRPVIRL
ncbi:hypothetical protein ACFL5V_13590, partial [Fibrobacterota bacterium]